MTGSVLKLKFYIHFSRHYASYVSSSIYFKKDYPLFNL